MGAAIAGYYPGIADINNIAGIISCGNEDERFISLRFIRYSYHIIG